MQRKFCPPNLKLWGINFWIFHLKNSYSIWRFFFRILGPPPASDDLEASPKKSAPVSLMSLNVEMPETSEEKLAPQTRDVKLPQGLEEVLAFKSKWATQQVRPF